MNLLTILCTTFLCLFTWQGAFCDDSFKKEFGKKLGAFIETSGIEFFQTAIRTVDNFYDTVVREASPTTEQIDAMKQGKIDLERLSKEIENGITSPQKFIQSVKDFLSSKYIKLWKFDEESLSAYTENQRPILLKAITESAETMEEASKNFAISIYNKWTELYSGIPQTELDKYSDYGRINELMQGVARTKGRGTVFLDVIRSLITFFDCEHWKFLLELGDYDPELKH